MGFSSRSPVSRSQSARRGGLWRATLVTLMLACALLACTGGEASEQAIPARVIAAANQALTTCVTLKRGGPPERAGSVDGHTS